MTSRWFLWVLYVIVPADKASNNIVFVCKSYYFECLIQELGINSNTSRNTTYKPTSFDKDEILANHRSFMTSLSIPSGKGSGDLPYLYWIPKLHKAPYKERYIAGSSTCSTYSPDKDAVCSKRGTTEIL
jgi:hypothetical protein